MRIFLFLLFLTLLSPSIWSQTLIVNVQSDRESLPFVRVGLIELATGDTVTKVSDFDGRVKFEDLKTEIFAVQAFYPEFQFERIDSLRINLSDSNELTLQARECDLSYPLKPCPKDHREKHVVRVRSDLVISMSFSSLRKELKYFRKVSRRGYESTIYESGEFVYNIMDKEQSRQLQNSSICDKMLYCKKHKILFY